MNLIGINKNLCPCCGKSIVAEEYEICNVCGWENDPIQRDHPEMRGGANEMSLEEARKAFARGQKVC